MGVVDDVVRLFRDRCLGLWLGCGLRGHFLLELKQNYDGADEATRRVLAQAAKLTLALMDGREVLL